MLLFHFILSQSSSLRSPSSIGTFGLYSRSFFCITYIKPVRFGNCIGKKSGHRGFWRLEAVTKSRDQIKEF
jgi:hypothetical protein